ncbi:uncharacterized protein LOC113492337 [Trichoplusia ni]|uniref:Uncharacterized protein LOC113492337 n=1 Tax=Trichoplusia ni TaxID=7111 RepID=A0A7E5VBE6_TRINI|nr:uncharacterized protein LOC113492337 [Trichoplusia ni]
MRSARRSKFEKNPYVHRNIKKKKRNKSKGGGAFNWTDDLSGLFLEHINQVLRENKARRADCKGSWKIMPKDSCEVYKNRRKRFEDNRQKQADYAAYSTCDTDCPYAERKKASRRRTKKKIPTRRVIVRDKRKKRPRSESTASHSSSSTSTNTSVTEMDY